jgi:hypothetical protein
MNGAYNMHGGVEKFKDDYSENLKVKIPLRRPRLKWQFNVKICS